MKRLWAPLIKTSWELMLKLRWNFFLPREKTLASQAIVPAKVRGNALPHPQLLRYPSDRKQQQKLAGGLTEAFTEVHEGHAGEAMVTNSENKHNFTRTATLASQNLPARDPPAPPKFNVPLAIIKAFKVSLEELTTQLNVATKQRLRAQSFILEEVIAWHGGLSEIWNVLVHREALLEIIGIEHVRQVGVIEDTASHILLVIKQGRGMTKELKWVEFPSEFENHVYMAFERIYLKGYFKYLRISFTLSRSRAGNWELKMQVHVALQTPRLKLLVMPMIEHTINKFKLFLRLLAHTKGNIYQIFLQENSQLNVVSYYLYLCYHWQLAFNELDNVLTREEKLEYKNFFFNQLRRDNKELKKHYLNSWHYQQHVYNQQQINATTAASLEKLGAQMRLASKASAQAALSKETRWVFPALAAPMALAERDDVFLGAEKARNKDAKSLDALIELVTLLPQALKQQLDLLSLAVLLKQPEEQLLRLFAQGVESNFFKLLFQLVCPTCQEIFYLKEAAPLRLTRLCCPYCSHPFSVATREINCFFRLNEDDFKSFPTKSCRFNVAAASIAVEHALLTGKVVRQVVLVSGETWSEHVILEPGTYQLICAGMPRGVTFIVDDDGGGASLPQPPSFTTFLLVCTSSKQLVQLVPAAGTEKARAEAAKRSSQEKVASSGDVAGATSPLGLPTHIRIVVENSVDTEDKLTVLRLIKLAQAPAETTRSLSLEKMIPYLIRYAVRTVDKFLPKSTNDESRIYFPFSQLTFILYEGHGSLADNGSLKEDVAVGTSLLLKYEDKWLASLLREHHVSVISGFAHQWLLVMPNKKEALRIMLEAFTDFFERKFLCRLALKTGGGRLYLEELGGPRLGWVQLGVMGPIFRELRYLLALAEGWGMMLPPELITHATTEKWLLGRKVDVKRVQTSFPTAHTQNKANEQATSYYHIAPLL